MLKRYGAPWLICGLAALFYVYDYFIQVAPSVITQQLMHDFSIDAAKLGLLSACFYYSYVIMQIPAGLLLDRFGARKILTFAILVSGGGVLLFGTTSSLSLAGLARFLVGIGAAFSFISTLFLAARWFSHRHFAFIAGVVQFLGMVGSMIGQAPLSMLVDHFGWRAVMQHTGWITLVLSVLFWLIIRDHGNQEHVLPETNHDLSNEWRRFKFVLHQKQLWWIALCGLLCWVPVATFGALWGVPYLVLAKNISTTIAGKWCIWFWLGLGIGSMVIGWYSDKIQRRKLPFVICFVAGLIGGAALVYAATLPTTAVLLALLLVGFSASVQSLSFGLVKDIMPPAAFGTASGFNNMAAIVGGGLSQPLFGFVLTSLWGGVMRDGVPVYALHEYQIAMLILPITALLGIIVSQFALRETHCQHVPVGAQQ